MQIRHFFDPPVSPLTDPVFARVRRTRRATRERSARIPSVIPLDLRAGHLPERKDSGIPDLELALNQFGGRR